MIKKSNNLLPFVLLLFLVITWGSSFSALKVVLSVVPPLWIMFIRVALGSIILLLWLFLKKRSLPFNKEFWCWSLILGFVGFALPFSVIAWGQQFIPSSLTAILMGLTPIITLLLTFFFLKEEIINVSKIMGIALGFLGLIFLISFNKSDDTIFNTVFISGQIAVLIGTASYSLASVLAKRISHISAIDRAVGSLICASFFGLILALFFAPLPDLTLLNSKIIILLLYLGILPSGIATVVWFKIIDLKGPLFLSMVNYLMPIWALFLGINLLNESINFVIISGLIFIFIGIWLIQRKNN